MDAELTIGGVPHGVTVREREPDRLAVEVDGRGEDVRVISSARGAHVVEVGGAIEPLFTARAAEGVWVWHRGRARLVTSAPPAAAPRRGVARGAPVERTGSPPGAPSLPAGAVTPPMPAVVTAVHVEEGQVVAPGDPLVTVSAMKLESLLVAPVAGRVAAVRTRAGASVRPGDVLVSVDPGGSHGG